MTLTPNDWNGRSVFLTGHTGFKGSWLSLWLHQLGTCVHGYALDPNTNPNLYDVANIQSCLTTDTRADLNNLNTLKASINKAQPEVIFHLAAQPLVRESYSHPLETFTTNVIGTAHVLEAARNIESIKAIVVITTDKVYEYNETGKPYREDDRLGGHDPYSASKAAAEIVTASYRKSFFQTNTPQVHIATTRSGNVIGGGDWSNDRLVPDCLHAFSKNESVSLRFPNAVRPWQHVLEPLYGYMLLAESLLSTNAVHYAKAWNFSPDKINNANVQTVAEGIAQIWGDNSQVICNTSDENPHEAGLLRLDNSLAKHELKWSPEWTLHQSLQATVSWYQDWLSDADMQAVTLKQINHYMDNAGI